MAVQLFMIASCSSEVKDTGPKYNFEKAESLPDDYLKELGIVKTNIELSAKLYELLHKNGSTFSESTMLSSSKNFNGTPNQAMGIGAIGTDLVYAISFKQNQSAGTRLEGLMSQANALDISEAFNKDLIEKLSSEDTTINKSILLTKAYLNAKDQLFSEERAQLATFMVIGGWIEGLNISTQNCKGKLDNLDIRLGLWEVCNTYKNVRGMTNAFSDNPEMQSVAETISTLEPLVNKISSNAKRYKDEDVAALAEAVVKIRASLL